MIFYKKMYIKNHNFDVIRNKDYLIRSMLDAGKKNMENNNFYDALNMFNKEYCQNSEKKIVT